MSFVGFVGRLMGCGLATVSLLSCGGNSATEPSDTGIGVSTSMITMTSSGVSPAVVNVPQGTRILFVNNDARSHEMASDPHPEHTDCPEINQVGFISPGQTKETGNLNTVRTCRYHDHNDPDNTRFQGRIVIQ